MKVQEAIKKRRTLKVLAKTNTISRDISGDMAEILEMGNAAPFHYVNSKAADKELTSLAPWRFYVLDGAVCGKLADYLVNNGIAAGKIIYMLRAAQSVIQVTWMPEASEEKNFVKQSINIEHVSATAAAVQNMLLTATSLGYENYWSSGGVLREDRFKAMFEIPLDEELLASVFLFDTKTENFKIKKGALRGRQGTIAQCSKDVKL
jgi:nitroreductase